MLVKSQKQTREIIPPDPEDPDFSDFDTPEEAWKALHIDNATGFKARSPALFFNDDGEEYLGNPDQTLFPGKNRESAVYMAADDFELLAWCITHQKKEPFEGYSFYSFSYEAWFSILKEAQELLTIEDFDTFFDRLTAWKIKKNPSRYTMLDTLNRFGARFWESREQHKITIDDLHAWSTLVLNATDSMNVAGL